MDICVVFPSPVNRSHESIAIRINDFIRLFRPHVDKISIIVPQCAMNYVDDKGIKYAGNVTCPYPNEKVVRLLIGEVKAWIQILIGIYRLDKDTDTIFFRGRLSTVIIPLLASRIAGYKCVLMIEAIGSRLIGDKTRARIYRFIELIAFTAADKIVVNVPNLISDSALMRYNGKVFPQSVSTRYINDNFRTMTKINDRENVIGYIGRMSKEKGIINMIEACRKLNIKYRSKLKFLFAGDGDMYQEVQKRAGYVQLLKWIDHCNMPKLLNKIKILVLPSDYEGMPTIILEAMACGVIVVANRIGAVPDVIDNGVNGFIVDSNKPDDIVECISRILQSDELDIISNNARLYIDGMYRYEILNGVYSGLISEINIP